MANELIKGGLTLVGGGTECHLLLVDLRPLGISGNVVAEALEAAGIVVNRNSVPNDTMPPFYPSGIRLGTPAVTTRGMKETEMEKIGDWILQVIEYVKGDRLPKDPESRAAFLKSFRQKVYKDRYLGEIAKKVFDFCKSFKIFSFPA